MRERESEREREKERERGCLSIYIQKVVAFLSLYIQDCGCQTRTSPGNKVVDVHACEHAVPVDNICTNVSSLFVLRGTA